MTEWTEGLRALVKNIWLAETVTLTSDIVIKIGLRVLDTLILHFISYHCLQQAGRYFERMWAETCGCNCKLISKLQM